MGHHPLARVSVVLEQIARLPRGVIPHRERVRALVKVDHGAVLEGDLKRDSALPGEVGVGPPPGAPAGYQGAAVETLRGYEVNPFDLSNAV